MWRELKELVEWKCLPLLPTRSRELNDPNVVPRGLSRDDLRNLASYSLGYITVVTVIITFEGGDITLPQVPSLYLAPIDLGGSHEEALALFRLHGKGGWYRQPSSNVTSLD